MQGAEELGQEEEHRFVGLSGGWTRENCGTGICMTGSKSGVGGSFRSYNFTCCSTNAGVRYGWAVSGQSGGRCFVEVNGALVWISVVHEPHSLR